VETVLVVGLVRGDGTQQYGTGVNVSGLLFAISISYSEQLPFVA